MSTTRVRMALVAAGATCLAAGGARADGGAPSSPSAEAGFRMPEVRLVGDGSILEGSEGVPAYRRVRRLVLGAPLRRAPTMDERIEHAAEEAAREAWLEHASVGSPREPLRMPFRMQLFVDEQLDIAAARAGYSLSANLSIGATLEVPRTEDGYELEWNRVTVGARLTF